MKDYPDRMTAEQARAYKLKIAETALRQDFGKIHKAFALRVNLRFFIYPSGESWGSFLMPYG